MTLLNSGHSIKDQRGGSTFEFESVPSDDQQAEEFVWRSEESVEATMWKKKFSV